MRNTDGKPMVKVVFLLLVVGLAFWYGWVAAPFVAKYTTGEHGADHPWFSTEQALNVQFLFVMAILIGVAEQLSVNPSVRLAKARDKWAAVNAVMAFLLMELPYIAAGILDLIHWRMLSGGFLPIYESVPFSVQIRFGVGDFVVSTLAAVWLGISLVRYFLGASGKGGDD